MNIWKGLLAVLMVAVSVAAFTGFIWVIVRLPGKVLAAMVITMIVVGVFIAGAYS